MTIPDSVSMAAPHEYYWFEWTMEDGGATLIKTSAKWPHQKDDIHNLKKRRLSQVRRLGEHDQRA